MNREGKSGILGAKGVCTCDEIGKCTCGTKDHISQSKAQTNKVESTTPTLSKIFSIIHNSFYYIYYDVFILVSDEQDTCENWCDNNVNMSIIIVFVFVTIGLVMYCCRNK